MGLLAGISGRRVLCLDWDPRTLRVVQATVGKGGVRVLGVGEISVPPDVEVTRADSFGEFLRSALRSQGLRGDRAVMVVPRQDAVLNPLTLPPTADSELASMVRFQVGKELPFGLDQAAVDFAILHREGGDRGSIEILVAAVRNHVVEHYKAVAEAAGLTLDRLGLRPYANMVALTQDDAHCKGRIVLVDVGPVMTEIDILRDGRLVFSRAAAVTVRAAGGSAAPGAPAAASDAAVIPFLDTGERAASSVDELLVEVTRTLAAYRASDPGAAIDRMIVAGSCGVENELAEAMAKRFEAPTSIYRPAEGFVRSLGRRVSVGWSGFGAVLGLAWGQVRTGTAHFDFLNPKKPVDVRREKLRRVPVVATLVALLFLSAGVAVGMRIHERSVKIRDLNAKLAAATKELDEIRDFTAKVTLADEWRKKRIVWLDEFRILSEAMPITKGAYLSELRTTEDGTIVLRVMATSGKVLDEFCESLHNLKTEKDARRYVITPGARTPAKDPKYQLQTDIRIQIEALVPKPATRKTGGRR